MKKLINFPYQNILVLGLARSGTAAAKTLLRNGKNVRINDMNAQENSQDVQELVSLGADVVLGSHPLTVLDNMELIVKNPGIPYDNPILQEAMKRKISIVTEIELAYQLVPGTLIGITGSNGKTTTTTLTTEMLQKSDQPVKVAGNIGIVATETAETLVEEETLVLELSSFQLQGTVTFRPNIAVILNVFSAHLDYHKTLENYKQAKYNIFKNQTEEDFLVYNAEDPAILDAVPLSKAKLIPFSVKRKVDNGAYADEDYVYFQGEKVIERRKIVLVGEHNLENILAAVSAAKLAGATNKGIEQVLAAFQGVKHRLQFIGKKAGRLFYNDSKATNMLATRKALSSFKQPVILLAGGLDRGDDFSELIPYLDNVKAMVCFGETKDKLIEAAQKANIEFVIAAENVEEAVKSAYDLSAEEDVILLSPACASWDQYATFEERGDIFIEAVHKLM
ncbi:UDP-N-acetylmuramoyl-L-alanine--D-glutamate ligase [Oceanobacillus sp. FSL H7-0719]|uniref:UDP-N-acetylmuramoyl-L-alanine--D-glutamate ligase n=1 Tax=Oceanobacillus sp. FSL H7-0719 TaxID=2954507 RepID=UPI00324F327D